MSSLLLKFNVMLDTDRASVRRIELTCARKRSLWRGGSRRRARFSRGDGKKSCPAGFDLQREGENILWRVSSDANCSSLSQSMEPSLGTSCEFAVLRTERRRSPLSSLRVLILEPSRSFMNASQGITDISSPPFPLCRLVARGQAKLDRPVWLACPDVMDMVFEEALEVVYAVPELSDLLLESDLAG